MLIATPWHEAKAGCIEILSIPMKIPHHPQTGLEFRSRLASAPSTPPEGQVRAFSGVRGGVPLSSSNCVVTLTMPLVSIVPPLPLDLKLADNHDWDIYPYFLPNPRESWVYV